MKHGSFIFLKLLSLILMSLFLISCARSYTLKLDKMPEPLTGSLLRGLKHKTFIVENFKDNRGTDPSWVGSMTTGLDIWEINLIPPAAVVATEMIKKELKRNGHTCVEDSSKLTPDYRIEGSVNKYMFSMFPYKLECKLYSTVIVKLNVISKTEKNTTYEKIYEGEYSIIGEFGGDIYIDILNLALLSMTRDFSSDAELISFLEKN